MRPRILLLFVSVSLNLCVIECYASPNFCVSAYSTTEQARLMLALANLDRLCSSQPALTPFDGVGFYSGLFSLRSCSLSVMVNVSFSRSSIILGCRKGFPTNIQSRYVCLKIFKSQICPSMSRGGRQQG